MASKIEKTRQEKKAESISNHVKTNIYYLVFFEYDKMVNNCNIQRLVFHLNNLSI